LISGEPTVAETVLSPLAHAPESSPDWTWEHYCQEEEGNKNPKGNLIPYRIYIYSSEGPLTHSEIRY